MLVGGCIPCLSYPKYLQYFSQNGTLQCFLYDFVLGPTKNDTVKEEIIEAVFQQGLNTKPSDATNEKPIHNCIQDPVTETSSNIQGTTAVTIERDPSEICHLWCELLIFVF